MDTSTGQREDEANYPDETLNAGWLPQPELALGLQSAVPAHPRQKPAITDPESFLDNMYRSQE